MIQPVTSGKALIEQIDRCCADRSTLWWLGQCGFVIKFRDIVFYLDPFLSPSSDRMAASPLEASMVEHAGLVLATSAHPHHMDIEALPVLLNASPRAKLVLPKSVTARAVAAGIPLDRLTTTDAGLRVEFFSGFDYCRIYAIPAAGPGVGYTPAGGCSDLGYLIRFAGVTIFTAGGSANYEGLVDRLRPYNVTLALVPIGDDCFSINEACQLAEDIGAAWIAPMNFGTMEGSMADASGFENHLLGQRPSQGFKIFRIGEGWRIPGD